MTERRITQLFGLVLGAIVVRGGHTVEKIVFLCFLVAVIVLLAELYRAPEAQQ